MREQEKHSTETADEFEKKMNEFYIKEIELIRRYEREIAQEMIRDAVRNELEQNRGGVETIFNDIKSYFSW